MARQIGISEGLRVKVITDDVILPIGRPVGDRGNLARLCDMGVRLER